MFEQTVAQVGQVPVGISGRSNAFVYLHNMHGFPGYVLIRQGTQHLPRRMTAADGHDEPATRHHGRPRLSGNDLAGLVGNRIGIGKNFNLRVYASAPDQPSTVGFCQPPGGTTVLSTSAGPQVLGSYSWTGVPAFTTGSTMRHASST